MSFLFGGARPSGADAIKDFQRKISSHARALEREIKRMDQKEAALCKEIKKLGADNRLDIASEKAKEMIRLRSHRARLYTVKGHMTGLAEQLRSVQSTQKIQETLAYTTRMLACLNQGFDAAAVHRMLLEFEKQNTVMTAKQEIIDDTLDSTFEVDGEKASTDGEITRVMQEAGLDMSLKMGSADSWVPSEQDLDERLRRLAARN